MAKGGSKFLTGLIAFILGFLFAIIAEVGAVFGVYWFAVNKDLNSLMSMVGIKNTDADGNYIYINTDSSNGGAANLKELFNGLKGLIYDNGEITALGKSFDDFEKLIPATNIILGYFYDAVGDYVEIDREEFESTPMSGLMQVISDSVMNVKTAALVEKLEISAITGENANPVIKSLLMGAETEYCTVYYGGASTAAEGGETSEFTLPVFYDTYVYDSQLGYMRERPVNGVSGYPSNLGGNYDWLCPVSKDDVDGDMVIEKYTLYYVPCKIADGRVQEADYSEKQHVVTENGKSYNFTVLEYGADTDFIVVKPDGEGSFMLNYNDVYATLDGSQTDYSRRFTGYSYYRPYAENYYYTEKDEATERWTLKTVSGKNYFRNNSNRMVQIDALTVFDLINDSFAPLDSVPAYSILGENSDVGYKVFGKTSLGALMRGEVDFDKILNDIEVGAFVTNVSPDNKVMAYIAYRLSDIKPAGNGAYTAVYDKYGDNRRTVTVYCENGYICEVRDVSDGSVLEGVKVKDVASLANNMSVTVLMDVDAGDAVLSYIGYGINKITPAAQGAQDSLGNSYDYSANLFAGNKPCYVSVNGDGIISSVWYIEGGKQIEIKGTTVSGLSDRIDGITDALTIGDVVDLKDTDNLLLKSIANTPISGLEQAITDVTVDDVFTEEEIMASAILRGLRGKKITELSTAIDGLYIQSIYAEEVYGLPRDTQPMQVINFNPAYKYYVAEQTGENGAKVVKFTLVNGDGVLTQEQFDNRGLTEYYTYGDKEGQDGAELKIAGYREERLYYTVDEAGAFVLVELNVPQGATESVRDDTVGYLKETQYESGKYYSYGSSKGMWRLVLNKDQREKAYTINNFNNMVNECAANVYGSTLGELYDAGLITDDIRGKKFVYTDGSGTQQSVQLEKLTLSGLIEIVLGMSVTE